METALISPANTSLLFIPSELFSILIPVAGLTLLIYILAKRMAPLVRSAPAFRFDQIPKRLFNMYEIPHHRMPRYASAGAIHITTLICLIVISLRFITMILSGISDGFVLPGLTGKVGTVYNGIADLAETIAFLVCIVAIVRRGVLSRNGMMCRNAMEKTVLKKRYF